MGQFVDGEGKEQGRSLDDQLPHERVKIKIHHGKYPSKRKKCLGGSSLMNNHKADQEKSEKKRVQVKALLPVPPGSSGG